MFYKKIAQRYHLNLSRLFINNEHGYIDSLKLREFFVPLSLIDLFVQGANVVARTPKELK